MLTGEVLCILPGSGARKGGRPVGNMDAAPIVSEAVTPTSIGATYVLDPVGSIPMTGVTIEGVKLSTSTTYTYGSPLALAAWGLYIQYYPSNGQIYWYGYDGTNITYQNSGMVYAGTNYITMQVYNATVVLKLIKEQMPVVGNPAEYRAKFDVTCPDTQGYMAESAATRCVTPLLPAPAGDIAWPPYSLLGATGIFDCIYAENLLSITGAGGTVGGARVEWLGGSSLLAVTANGANSQSFQATMSTASTYVGYWWVGPVDRSYGLIIYIDMPAMKAKFDVFGVNSNYNWYVAFASASKWYGSEAYAQDYISGVGYCWHRYLYNWTTSPKSFSLDIDTSGVGSAGVASLSINLYSNTASSIAATAGFSWGSVVTGPPYLITIPAGYYALARIVRTLNASAPAPGAISNAVIGGT